MARPAFVKLGGSVLTDKAREATLQRAQAKRLLAEVAKVQIPTVLFHGAGSYGHPPASQAGLGRRSLTTARGGVSKTLAASGLLHAMVVDMAQGAGLEPVSVPLHLNVRSEGHALVDMPVRRIQAIVDDGCTPVLAGTVVRDDELGWRIASADELMVALAHDIEPRMGLFVTDVDGVYDRDPATDGASLLREVDGATTFDGSGGPGVDATGRMHTKVARAVALAQSCPVLIANGTVRGRIHDLLRGKSVPSTRVQA